MVRHPLFEIPKNPYLPSISSHPSSARTLNPSRSRLPPPVVGLVPLRVFRNKTQCHATSFWRGTQHLALIRITHHNSTSNSTPIRFPFFRLQGGVLSRRNSLRHTQQGSPRTSLGLETSAPFAETDSKFERDTLPTETTKKSERNSPACASALPEPVHDSPVGTSANLMRDISVRGIVVQLELTGDDFRDPTRRAKSHSDTSVAMDADDFSENFQLSLIRRIARLPPDLSQIVFNALVCSKRLPLGGVKLTEQFKFLWTMDLSEVGDDVGDAIVGTLLMQNVNTLLSLSLARCVSVTTHGLNPLKILPFVNLNMLDLSECPSVTDGTLQVLLQTPNLHTLRLEGCVNLEGGGLKHVASLKKLKHLSLERCAKLKSVTVDLLSDDSGPPSLVGSDDEEEHVTPRPKKQKCERRNSAKKEDSIGGVPALGNLQSLETLNLGWCNQVSDDDVFSLRSLTQLKTLVLARTKAGPRSASALRHFKNLIFLDLTGTKFDDISVSVLTELHEDDVSDMDTDDEELNDSNQKQNIQILPSLQTLSLEATAITGFAASGIASSLSHLTGLNVAFTEMSDEGVKQLAKMQTLNALNLDSCPVGDVAARWIAKLKKLTSLTLADTDVGNEGVENLARGAKELVHLDLGHTLVDDEGVAYLKTFKFLKSLSLDSRLVTDTGVVAAICDLRDLETLDLFAANVTDVTTAAFRNLNKLKSLEMCGGNITDVGVARISSFCTQLETLNLGQNSGVTNDGATEISRLKHLMQLNLTGSRVTDTGVRSLTSLKNLTTLAVKDCRGVTKESVTYLKTNLPRLAEVTFADRERKTVRVLNSQGEVEDEPEGVSALGTSVLVAHQIVEELTSEAAAHEVTMTTEIFQEETSDDENFEDVYEDVN